MESGGSHRSGRLTAGGVLSIVGGAFAVVGAGTGVAAAVSAVLWSREHCLSGVRCVGGVLSERVIIGLPIFLGIAAFGVALGLVAIVGGVSALRRKSFGLSLVGAICALASSFFGTVPIGVVLPVSVVAPVSHIYGVASVILGTLAIVFVALSKSEFGAERKEIGV